MEKQTNAEKLGIQATALGEELLENPSPIVLEFIEWFKATRPNYVEIAQLSTFTNGEPYFSILGIEKAEITLRDFLLVKFYKKL